MSDSGEAPTLEIEVRDPSRKLEGEQFSHLTGIPLVSSGRVPPGHLRVVFLADAVELWDHECVRRGTRVDFTRIDTRVATGNVSKKQPLARAVGRHTTQVVDATTGFGHDAILLACMGFTVTAIERNPLIHLLLKDAVQRSCDHPELGPILSNRFQLKHADAIQHLQELNFTPDTIYLDPMFESGGSRTALPQKPAQILRTLVGADHDSIQLFDIAIKMAGRVVVKRTDKDPPLAGTPTHSIHGKIVRYDVYINN